MNPRPASQIEVKGQGLVAIIDAMSLIQSHAVNLLSSHGLNPIDPEKWYSMQSVLDAFKIIGERIGRSTMKSIGRKVPNYTQIPANLQTLDQVLSQLDKVYKATHRGPGNVGSYLYKPTGVRSAQLTTDSPYMCELDEGLLETLCERYKPKGSLWVRVAHDPSGCRNKGAVSCTYDISW